MKGLHMHPVSSAPSFHTPRAQMTHSGADGPGKSAQSVGHQAKAAVAAAQEAGMDVPKNAQGYASSMIAQGADPATVFAAMVEEPAPDAPVDGTEPAVADIVEGDPVEAAPLEGETVEAAPVESEPVETAPVEAESVESAPVEGEQIESAPPESDGGEDPAVTDSAPAEETVSAPETSDQPEIDIVDPEVALANAALTDDEAALELLNEILDQPSE